MKDKKVISDTQLKTIKRILILQYKPFGDVLLNTAYLFPLRKAFPDAKIDYLVQRPFKVILDGNPNIDNLILMDKKKRNSLEYYSERMRIIKIVRENKYDLILDTMRGPGTSQIALFSGARFKIGWKKTKKFLWLNGYNWVYNYTIVRDQKIYAGRAKFQILEPLGIKETNDNIFFNVKPESKEYINNWLKETGLIDNKFIVFSPVTPVPRKQWEFHRFAQTADMIKEKHGYEIVLLWGPGEKEKVEYMASLMKTKPIMAIPTNFNQAGALLQKTHIYIGNDGGIVHLSVSQNTPTISIFGPKTDPLKWSAWHLPIHKYLRDFDFTDKKDNSFNISPEMVYEKFVELDEYLVNKQ
ncbi:MAG: glycosyltransferase family 9 protein [Candidatus Cloacimonetes bacterium]|nr:glycosyltransferase family 9 protein [Candidatus Cloacimonadota bacterium]